MRRRGFTLLEILLTLVLLVIVLGILHACLGAILASTEHGRAIARSAVEERNLLALIESDLRGAVLVPPKPADDEDRDRESSDEQDPNAFVGGAGMIRFATSSPPRGEGADAPRVVRLIEYSLKPVGKDRSSLVRASKLLENDAPRKTWDVTDMVGSFKVRFTDGTEWKDTWDSQAMGALPRTVRIELELMTGEKSGSRSIRLESSVIIQSASLEPPDDETKDKGAKR